MRDLLRNFVFLWMFLSTLSYSVPVDDTISRDKNEIEARQLGPIGLTVLGALTLPILIPVGVARLVSRLTNLGNSTSSTGVTIRPVILPGRPLRLPHSRRYNQNFK
ncbi:hypothetical protein JTE90_022493 [Oedothorax gibbosus]|uniref:Uncharacterized protein n=1 Tax=Oedothorax gibbosus TaxID=931172 RepID=A0AAV6V1D2_9ARAC|nr:hypothetical protein JTE90_022493 [Oedothorax gibbosus]